MRVRVNFFGTLSRYTGAESVEIELKDGARYGDLLAELGRRYGAEFPEKIWSNERVEFLRPVAAIGASGDIDERDTPLADGEEIHILIPISGGNRGRRGIFGTVAQVLGPAFTGMCKP